MNLDKLKGFCVFVESEACYETASKKVNMSISGLYKSIKSLEADVRYKLVDMVGGSPVITKHGTIFYRYAKLIQNLAGQAVAALDEDSTKLAGTINILTTVAIAGLWITDDIAEFVKKYPEIQINVMGSDQPFDKMENYDIAIRPKVEDPLNMFEQKLITTQEMRLYASEGYISQFGMPLSPDDLKSHRLIGYGEGLDYPYDEINWHLYLKGTKIKPFFNINSGLGILRSVENGIGIGPVSNIGATISRVPLIRILPELKGPIVQWYFITSKIISESKKIQFFYEYIKNRYMSKIDYNIVPSSTKLEGIQY